MAARCWASPRSAPAGDVEFDQGVTDARNTSGGITLGGDLTERWTHQLTVGHAREDLDTIGAFSNSFQSRRTSLDWVNSLKVGADARLNLGVNWQDEDGESSTAFSGPLFDESRTSQAVFAGYGGSFGAHVLDFSLRRDDSNQYGGATTGNAAWGWNLSEALQVRLSWGEGFRAPNFNELYYPDGGFGYAGNPDLRPESSETREAGLAYRPAQGHQVGLSAYRSRVRDLIAFAAPLTNNAININRAELEGVELEYRYTQGGWNLGGNLTWQDAVDAATNAPCCAVPTARRTWTWATGSATAWNWAWTATTSPSAPISAPTSMPTPWPTCAWPGSSIRPGGSRPGSRT
ncbi:TonB-dependent receptor domain-containing protein [Arenimonas daejeonensis]|uniref:TonB-dependent receptor domain-containing protein n=1 Tax=Arenimonas daejeonensis TaxID=370777 RepID=UPI0013152F57|nr:TonB-dependent receptor [Arenimonas daejeonensis]